MYKLYSIGARTKPCGTPAATFVGEESSHSTETLNFLVVIKEAISLTRLVEKEVEVEVTLLLTASQSVSLGVEPPSGAHDQMFFFYCLTFTVLFLWGALSDERTGLSFVYAAGPC
jgi:hypothetical protein